MPPWRLDIHMIDVGQGESSFVVAQDMGGAGTTRTMLIDGGHPSRASVVHDYVRALGLPVHHIVCSHYDGDHSGGVQALLIADNLWRICETIGATVAAVPSTGVRPRDVAAYAAAAYGACVGAWGANAGAATLAMMAARLAVAVPATDAVACATGIDEARLTGFGPLGTPLARSTTKRGQVARAVAVAVASAAAANRAAAGRDAAFQQLRTATTAGARFPTHGLYANTHLIDIGTTTNLPVKYVGAVAGRCYWGGGSDPCQAPNLNRDRTSADTIVLGSEVLWGTGAGPCNPPANAPAGFLVAARKYVWKAAGGLCPIASTQPDNDVSIGLIFRFNNFFYWTGGDLPYQGEDIAARSVRHNGLPIPGAGAAKYGTAGRIALFKCGHHGSAGSTSQYFLDTANPAAALISCGYNTSYEHPDDATLDRLHGQVAIRHFYLTNCNFDSDTVPASKGLNQLTAAGNKSRVAGDNNRANLWIPRHRGDIRVRITQGSSILAAGDPARVITTEYWDEDAGPAGVRNENTVF